MDDKARATSQAQEGYTMSPPGGCRDRGAAGSYHPATHHSLAQE